MLKCSASLEMSTSIHKALPGKLDIKRLSPSILYLDGSLTNIVDPDQTAPVEAVLSESKLFVFVLKLVNIVGKNLQQMT